VAARSGPVLDGLARRFGETAFIARLGTEDVECIATSAPHTDSQAHVRPGRVMPPHAAASAKAILAFRDPAQVERLLRRSGARYTERTRTSPEQVRAELDRVRERGYATCDEEFDPGVMSCAVPVRLGTAGVLYSVGVVGPAPRMADLARDELVEALDAAARSLGPILEDAAGARESRP
jgi:DNA-binding IclR family transcriptional regulator